MRKKSVVGMVVLLLVALLVWAVMPAPAEVEIATVTQGRFERVMEEDGKTRVRERYVVSTPLTGHVARIHLKEGDPVAQDAIVATLWPVTPALLDARNHAEKIARIGTAQATVARTQANVDRAGAALAQAQAELTRGKALQDQGFISPHQNEILALNVRLRDKELTSARQDEAAALHELTQSRVASQQFFQATPDRRQAAYPIRAPVSGKVLKVLQANEGMQVAGTPLLELGDPAKLEVEVDMLTEDAAQMTPGMAVRLSQWGGTGELAGQVRRVAPAAFTKISALGVQEQRVNTVIDVTSPTEQWLALGDGFKVNVRVLVQVVEEAVMVPVSALFPMGTDSGLFVLEKGRAEVRQVEVAARNGEQAWVRSGLVSGTKVIVYPDTQLKTGDRVTVR